MLNPRQSYLNNLAEGSRRAISQALDRAARALTDDKDNGESYDWSSLNYAKMCSLRNKLIESSLAPASVNKILSAVRSVVKEAARLGLLSHEAALSVASVKMVRNGKERKGRHLSTDERLRLIKACRKDPGASGMRDEALISCMYMGALRRDEVCKINLEDLDLATGELTVRGKGKKERIVYIVNGAKKAVAKWYRYLRNRAEDYAKIEGQESAWGKLPMFVRIRNSWQKEFSRLKPHNIYSILRKRGREAKIKDFTPHDLRRTAAGDMLSAGADLSTVQKILGHSSPITTALYDRRPGEVREQAANSISLTGEDE